MSNGDQTLRPEHKQESNKEEDDSVGQPGDPSGQPGDQQHLDQTQDDAAQHGATQATQAPDQRSQHTFEHRGEPCRWAGLAAAHQPEHCSDPG